MHRRKNAANTPCAQCGAQPCAILDDDENFFCTVTCCEMFEAAQEVATTDTVKWRGSAEAFVEDLVALVSDRATQLEIFAALATKIDPPEPNSDGSTSAWSEVHCAGCDGYECDGFGK